MPLRWPLVGRDDELAQVAEAMDDARQRRPARRTGRRRQDEARDGVGRPRPSAAGGGTRWCGRTAASGTIPFGAFAPLLPPATPASTPEAQSDALRAASEAIAASAGDTALLLIVDDAQELDDASAALVSLLTASDRIFLVVTVRTEEPPPPEALTALWKDELIVRVEVPELTQEAATELVSEAVGGPVDGVTMQTLHTTSGGNALFLRELVSGALDAGTLQETNGMWRLRGELSPSTRLGEVVGLRLGGLDVDERHALEVVSLGEPVGVSDLAALASARRDRRARATRHHRRGRRGQSPPGPDGAPALRGGRASRIARAPAAKTDLTRELAEQVESHGTRRREDVLRVALWRLDSGGGQPELLCEGAQQAIFAFDFVLAERFARAAWDAAPSSLSGRLLGETLDNLGRHEQSEEIWQRTEALAENDSDRALAARARSSNMFRGLGRAAEAEQLLADAQAAITDPELRDELRSQHAVQLVFEGRLPETLEVVAPLLASDSQRIFVHGALPGAVANAIAGNTAVAIDIADRAFEARVALGDQLQMSGPGIYLIARGLALIEAGRLDEADDNALLGYEGATDRQLADGQAWFATALGARRAVPRPRAAGGAVVPRGGRRVRRRRPPGRALGLRRPRPHARARR